MLKSSAPAQEEEEDPLAYYENHTSQIEVGPEGSRGTVGEGCDPGPWWQWPSCDPVPVRAQIVRQDRSMEQIVFPVPGICQFLTEETKHRLFTTTEQDEQGSKVSDFFDQSSFLHNEMEWQRKLRSEDWAGPDREAGLELLSAAPLSPPSSSLLLVATLRPHLRPTARRALVMVAQVGPGACAGA